MGASFAKIRYPNPKAEYRRIKWPEGGDAESGGYVRRFDQYCAAWHMLEASMPEKDRLPDKEQVAIIMDAIKPTKFASRVRDRQESGRPPDALAEDVNDDPTLHPEWKDKQREWAQSLSRRLSRLAAVGTRGLRS